MEKTPRDPKPFAPGPDWTPAKPEHMALPTFWPAALALGSTLLVWGLISSWIISVVGVAVFAVSISGWIQDIRHERAAIE